MSNKIALVTNVLDYAGPPAVKSLKYLKAGLKAWGSLKKYQPVAVQ